MVQASQASLSHSIPELRPTFNMAIKLCVNLQQAELLAFAALVEAKLEPATLYTTWCEAESYNRHTRAAFAAGLPLPLNYWLPWNQRRAILRRFAGTPQAQVR